MIVRALWTHKCRTVSFNLHSDPESYKMQQCDNCDKDARTIESMVRNPASQTHADGHTATRTHGQTHTHTHTQPGTTMQINHAQQNIDTTTH